MFRLKKKFALTGAAALTFVALACQAGETGEATTSSATSPAPAVAAAAPTSVPPTPVPPTPIPPTPIPISELVTTPTRIAEVKPILEPTAPSIASPTPELANTPVPTPNASTAPQRLTYGWDQTDFTKHSVPFSEIFSGGPPRDGIPPIDSPKFIPVSDTPDYMNDNEPVVTLEINGESKAYPVAILMWHEIVNDVVGGVPVTVTFCPLCNTAIVFDRRLGDTVYDFGTSGNLRKSDLVMWDRQTESWWQQINGEAIVGELTGAKLTFIPAPMVSWADYRDATPDGELLSRETGFGRNYNRAPYTGYDELDNTPFLFSGQIDDKLPAMERVVGMDSVSAGVAYPFSVFESVPIVNDTVDDQDIVIFYAPETDSGFTAFNSSDPRVIGSTGVYDPNVDDQKLTFKLDSGDIVDEQTGSVWNMLGEAIEGELAGKQLDSIVHANHFWFAWSAFFPESELRTAEFFGS
ncbi:MAG: DUF3179 domain-containing protein [SAR202 cluster bacterium]|nr:DUF3179 domain-containing protein [SAR202 cluster bacterium]MDP6714782.1 DUF3179 domain-containing protein [SAR202 cluster bacterium]